MLLACILFWLRAGEQDPPGTLPARPQAQEVPVEMPSGTVPARTPAQVEQRLADAGRRDDGQVTVTDSGGRPVESATVRVAQEWRTRVLGRTDGDGRLRVVLDEFDTALLAEAAGHAPATHSLQGPRRSEYVIRLGSLAVLRGLVLDAGTGVPAPGVLVRAWRSVVVGLVKAPDSEALESLLGGESVSGPDGRFVIEGLNAGEHYDVIAYGPGRISDVSQAMVAGPADRDVILNLLHIHGALLRVTDASGTPVIGDVRGLSPGWVHGLQKTVYLNPSRYDLTLAGIPPTAIGRINPRHWLVLHAAPQVGTPLGIVSALLSAPGYSSRDVEVPLMPVSDGLAEVVVPLERWAEGFGTVRVFVNDPLGSTGPSTNGPGWIRLHPAEESLIPQDGYRYAVDTWGASPIELEGVPFGKYVLYFEAPAGGFRRSGKPAGSNPRQQVFEVGSDPVDVHVDATDTAGLEVVVLDEQARPVDRVLRLTLRAVGGRGSLRFVFSGPPYQASLLPPGTWRIEATEPIRATAESGDAGVELVAGQRTTVRLLPAEDGAPR